MGFFKDFKQDLSQAVNELTDEAAGMAASDVQDKELSDDVMVDTLTEAESEEALNAELEAMINGKTEEAAPLEEEIELVQPAEEESAASADEKAEEPGTADDEISASDSGEAALGEEAEGNAVSDETAIITPGLRIKGDIESTGSIELLGTVEGNVTCRGKLVASGNITGNTQSAEFFSDRARIHGDINCDGPAKIGNGSVIKGSLFATSAVIAGAIKGDVDVHGPVIIDTSAVVIGDIKSKSVQINNGAVIDGRVSQCYADLKPVTIFGED